MASFDICHCEVFEEKRLWQDRTVDSHRLRATVQPQRDMSARRYPAIGSVAPMEGLRRADSRYLDVHDQTWKVFVFNIVISGASYTPQSVQSLGNSGPASPVRDLKSGIDPALTSQTRPRRFVLLQAFHLGCHGFASGYLWIRDDNLGARVESFRIEVKKDEIFLGS